MHNLSLPLFNLRQHVFDRQTRLDMPEFCPRCQDMLALFVTDELAGEIVDSLYPDVAFHLERCPVCLQEYEILAHLLYTALINGETA